MGAPSSKGGRRRAQVRTSEIGICSGRMGGFTFRHSRSLADFHSGPSSARFAKFCTGWLVDRDFSFSRIGLLFPLAPTAIAQGGPPYYPNDPGTPGPFNGEINIGYMPFFYSNQSVSHT